MWTEPKTDWHVSYDSSGKYTGDTFDYRDYNRIKNNVSWVCDIVKSLFTDFETEAMGSDKTEKSFVYPKEINDIVSNLKAANRCSLRKPIGNIPVYYGNQSFMTWEHLNIIEGLTLDIYNEYNNLYEGRRMFKFNFGINEGSFN